MKLNKQQKKKLLNHLTKKAPKAPKCAVCHHNKWNVSDTIFETREYTNGTLTVGGAIIPFINLVCKNCGNILFFNAIVLDIIQSKKRDSKNE